MSMLWPVRVHCLGLRHGRQYIWFAFNAIAAINNQEALCQMPSPQPHPCFGSRTASQADKLSRAVCIAHGGARKAPPGRPVRPGEFRCQSNAPSSGRRLCAMFTQSKMNSFISWRGTQYLSRITARRCFPQECARVSKPVQATVIIWSIERTKTLFISKSATGAPAMPGPIPTTTYKPCWTTTGNGGSYIRMASY